MILTLVHAEFVDFIKIRLTENKGIILITLMWMVSKNVAITSKNLIFILEMEES